QAMQNRWFVPHSLVNKNGYQDAVLQYEHASAKDISEGVDRMYRQFYFRFRKITSILRGMVTDAHEMSRRLREGMEFLGYLLARRKMAENSEA
ncbi:MAG TPA: hopanoid biosynthesis associated radical SAM protein HpnJ, partial [Planctomycetota bacterium]|nr:hopanoid biosynthesis associated radical SAM protein HpnJ [Planctomycetota bacterium]